MALSKKKIKFIIFAFLMTAALAIIAWVILSRLGTQKARVYNQITKQDIDKVKSSYKPISNQVLIPDFTIAAEDESSALLVSEKTANVALYNKQSGKIYYTAMTKEAAEKSKPGSALTKSQMMSQLLIKACEKDGTLFDINSYDMCVANGNFGICNMDKGVEITYLLGEVKKDNILPKGLTEKRFKVITEKLSYSDKREFQKRYRKVDASSESKEEGKKLIEQYPAAKDGVIYVLRDGLENYIVDKIINMLSGSGYTMEDKYRDEKFFTDTQVTEIPPVIKVVVDYLIDKGDLVVSVDKSKIKYTNAEIPLELTMMEYLFSAGKEENGYMLVPDGSGSIINLNNGKSKYSIYKSQIYGLDLSTQPVLSKENNIAAPMPVYGLKMKDAALFAEIEEGDALASIYADVSGRVDQVNKVYPVFKLREQNNELVFLDYTSAGGGTVYANRIQPGELSGKLTVRFTVLNGQNQGYSEMASLYRNRLVSKGVLKKKKQDDVPLLIDIVGAVDVVKPVFGIPQNKVIGLTTYNQAKQIAGYFKSDNVGNLAVKYVGGFQGGIKHSALGSLKAESALGSSKQMTEMFSWFKQNDISLFMDASFTYVPKNSMFDNFQVSKDTIRLLNNKRGRIFELDMPTFYYSSYPKYAIKPSKIPYYMDKFTNSLKKYQVGLSVRDMGNIILSDFSIKEPVFRDKSESYYAQVLKDAEKKGTGILVNGANMYTLPYTQFVSMAPSQSNSFSITDESVPFYQMVIHGYCDYVYTPINLSDDYRYDLLKAIETGSGIYGAVYYKTPVALKESEYSQYYASDFEKHRSSITQAYNEVKNALKDVYSSKIIGHRRLAPDVYITEYDNQKSVIVNYGNNDFIQDGIRVKAMNYLLVG